MECYEIEWKGPYPAETAHEHALGDLGLYCVYVTQGKTLKKPWYIGQSKDVRRRSIQHFQEWQSGLSKVDLKKRMVCFGTVHPVESHYINGPQLRRIESFLINHCKPPRNADQTKKGHTIHPMLIVNTGKIGSLDKVMCRHTEFLTLLSQNIKPKKKRVSSDSW